MWQPTSENLVRTKGPAYNHDSVLLFPLSLVKLQCLFLLLGLVHLLMSLFLTCLYFFKGKILPTETRTVTAHFSGRHTLCANGSFSLQRKLFHPISLLPSNDLSQTVKITSFAHHRGAALTVGLPRSQQRDSELILANHPTSSVCFLVVIIQNIQARAAHLTGMVHVTNYG